MRRIHRIWGHPIFRPKKSIEILNPNYFHLGAPQLQIPGVLTPRPQSHGAIAISSSKHGINGNTMEIYDDNRRKFRSQTSDNTDRWKSRGGKSQVREEKRGEKKRSEEKRREEKIRSEKRKSQKKEDAGARKGRKVAKHNVFPMIGGSGGSKSRLAKASGAEPSGQVRDEKLLAVVARSTCRSQNVKKNNVGPLLEVDMSKKCTPLRREAHFEVNSVNN